MEGVTVLFDLATKERVFWDTEGYFPTAIYECAVKYEI